jgi:hypothetical protein
VRTTQKQRTSLYVECRLIWDSPNINSKSETHSTRKAAQSKQIDFAK